MNYSGGDFPGIPILEEGDPHGPSNASELLQEIERAKETVKAAEERLRAVEGAYKDHIRGKSVEVYKIAFIVSAEAGTLDMDGLIKKLGKSIRLYGGRVGTTSIHGPGSQTSVTEVDDYASN